MGFGSMDCLWPRLPTEESTKAFCVWRPGRRCKSVEAEDVQRTEAIASVLHHAAAHARGRGLPRSALPLARGRGNKARVPVHSPHNLGQREAWQCVRR